MRRILIRLRGLFDLNNDGRDAKDLGVQESKTQKIEIVGGKMEIEGLQDGLKTISQNNKKEVWSQPNPTDVSRVQLQDKRTYCEVKGKLGFLKFNKQIAGVKIGSASAQPFKLLQCLTEPFGTAKTIDTIFEAIRENVKNKNKSGVYTSSIDKSQKATTH